LQLYSDSDSDSDNVAKAIADCEAVPGHGPSCLYQKVQFVESKAICSMLIKFAVYFLMAG
jgi:hypothetical protein